MTESESKPSTLSELDNLSAVFEFRVLKTWDVYESGEHEEAEEMAEQLLSEPRLSKIHQASVHLLLSSCSDDFLHHAKEAVRVSGEVLQDFEFTSEQRANVVKMVDAAEAALRRARSDQADMDREVNRLLASGKTMSDLHDEQFKALQEQELLAQENDAREGDAQEDGV